MTQAKPAPRAATQTSVSATSGGAATPQAVYEGLRAQRRELSNQLDELEGTRRSIISQLEDVSPGDAARKPLETRMTEIDGRISSVDAMLASNSAQLAQAAAVPGAVVEQPVRVIQRSGPPEEAYVVGIIFLVIAMFPISIAFARRIWKRGAGAVTSFPRELAERLSRIEQGMEATSLEVERIGEGQRFLTRLFTEGEGTRAIPAAKAGKLPERLP